MNWDGLQKNGTQKSGIVKQNQSPAGVVGGEPDFHTFIQITQSFFSEHHFFFVGSFGTMLAHWMASTLRTMYISYALKYIKNSKHKTVHVFFAQNHGFDTSTQK